MYDTLIELAADTFAELLPDQFCGAPYEELHDVMTPAPIVWRAIRETSEKLSITVMASGDAWDMLCNSVVVEYNDNYTGEEQ